MNYWDSVGRWINTLLVFIVGVLAFDALFRLLEANPANVIVAFVRVLAVVFLVPFQGMFGEQDYVLTTLIGVLGYALLAGIALGVLRSLQASRAQPAPPVRPEGPARPVGSETTAAVVSPAAPAVTAGDRAPQAIDAASADAPSDRPRRSLEQQTGRRRTADDGDRLAQPERPEASQGNGRPQRRRPRADAPQRTRRDGRTRDRAGARGGSTHAPDVDTGS